MSKLITQQEYTLIRFWDAINLMPFNYIDKIYIEHRRPVRSGVNKEMFWTTEKYALTYDSDNHLQRLIQAKVYDRYILEFIKTESSNVEMMEFCQEIEVNDYGTKKTLKPVIIDIQVNKVTGSSSEVITIEFYDKNIQNYFNQEPVTSPLRSDKLLTRYDVSQLNRIFYYDSSASTWTYFYTAIPIIDIETDPENVEQMNLNGQKLTVYNSTRTRKEIIVYLNDEDLQTFKNLMAKAGEATGTTNGDRAGISGTPNTYTIEMPEFETEKISGAVDVNKVTLRFTTAINENKKYS